MTRFHQDGIVRIQAERSAQSGIFLWLKDCDGKEHVISLECEQEMYGIRDAMVDAINGVQAKAAPTADPVITWPRPSYHRQATGARSKRRCAECGMHEAAGDAPMCEPCRDYMRDVQPTGQVLR